VVRIHVGEPNSVFLDVRYLIDFITDISDVSSGLSPLESDPGVDSNSLSDHHPQTGEPLAKVAEKHRPLSGHMHARPSIIVEELSGRPFEIM
jgi:hypothetical protein